MADDERQTLTLTEAASRLGMSVSTVRRSLREGKLPFPTVQIRGRHLVSKAVLDRYISGQS